MDVKSYLNPAGVKEQCQSAKQVLCQDNQELSIVESGIDSFAQNWQIKSTSFSNLKIHMMDYKVLLKAMRAANSSDILDYEGLQRAVGSTVLNGSQILEQQKVCIEQKQNAEQSARCWRDCRTKLLSCGQLVMAERANWLAKHNENMAIGWQEKYKQWKEKEAEFDDIEAATSGYLKAGDSMRTAIASGLSDLSGSFQNGSYVLNLSAPWRAEIEKNYAVLTENIINRAIIVDEYGNVTGYDTKIISDILGKDETQIQEYEYMAIAYIFGTSNDVDVQEYILQFGYDYKDALKIVEGMGISTEVVEYEKNGKLLGILEQLEELRGAVELGALLYADDKERSDYVMNSKFKEIIESENILRQIVNAPDSLVCVSSQNLNGLKKVLTNNVIELSRDEEGNSILKYCENKYESKNPYSFYESDLHIITISKLKEGQTARNDFEDADFEWYVDRTGMPRTDGDVFKNLAARLGISITGNGIEAAALGKLPGGISGVISSTVEVNKDIAKKNAYQQYTEKDSIQELVDNYNLWEIRIQEDVGGSSRVNYSIAIGYGDTTTQDRINNANNYLKEKEFINDPEFPKEHSFPITIEDIYGNPKKLIDINNFMANRVKNTGGMYEPIQN